MRTNLTMIVDLVDQADVMFRRDDPLHARRLTRAVLYDGETSLSPDLLYVAQASDLAERPVIGASCSVICLGNHPAAYDSNRCEIADISPDMGIVSLFNRVQEVFSIYQAYELRLIEAAHAEEPLVALGEVAYDLLKNPLACFNATNRALFIRYDRTNPVTKGYYESEPDIGSYMSDEEEGSLDSIPNFEDTLAHTDPTFYPRGRFRFDGIYANIMEGEQLLGRVVMDQAYRDFIPSDYALIKWLCASIKEVMMRSSDITFAFSQSFERMVSALALDHTPYEDRFDAILAENGWSRTDHYKYVFLRPTVAQMPRHLHTGYALYLNQHFDSKYLLVSPDSLAMVLNLSKSDKAAEHILGRLAAFAERNPYCVAVSSTFDDFASLWEARQQAEQACAVGQKVNTAKRVHFFDELALDLMLANIRGEFGPGFYRTNAVRRLMAYDAEHKTELCRTLEVYLSNSRSVTRSLEDLFVCRTTFLYRLNRIEEITGLDLNNPNTRLYLQLVFRMEQG